MANVTAPQFQEDVNNAADWANGDENTTVTMRLGQQARSPAKVIADIQTEFDAALIEINKSRGFRVVGTFADGFTYELLNDVGIDGGGNYWIYNGAVPFVVAPGTVPSSPDYTQVIFADHSNLTNRDSPNSHPADAISTKSGSNAQAEIETQKSVCFIFDDAYESVIDVLLPLFQSYGASFGSAVPFASLGNPGRLDINGVKKASDSGIEIINHAASGDALNTTDKGIGGFRGEISTCWSAMQAIGINVYGFQTPSSILNAIYKPLLKGFCSYAFTEATTQSVQQKGTDVYSLARFSIESATQTECTDAIDNLNNEDSGAIIFYAHDIVNADANYNKIVAILDKCVADGVPVLLPSQCIAKSIDATPYSPRSFYDNGLITNDPYGFTATNGATVSVSSDFDLTMTLPGANTYLLQEVVNFESGRTNLNDLVNLSSLIRDLNGVVTNCAVGIHLYDDFDLAGTKIYEATEEDIDLNNTSVRYYNEARKGVAKSALLYFRVTSSGAGDVLFREITCRFGTSIEGVRHSTGLQLISGVESHVIPSQAVTAGSGYQDVTPPTVDNDLYSNQGNAIVFKRNATVQFSASLVESGTNVGVGFLGGGVLISDGTANRCTNPIAGGDGFLCGESSLVMKVTRGTALRVKAIAYGTDFNVGTSSRLTISEI